MTKPATIQYAILALWASIIASALLALVDRWLGFKSPGQFTFELIAYGAICVIPYKIANRSNAARYWYAVITVMSLIATLNLDAPRMSLVSRIGSFVLLMVGLLTLYWLFTAESNAWFGGTYSERNDVRKEPSFGGADSDRLR